jgi:hypothetical protein
MMNITTFREKLTASVNHHREGESYEALWRRQRECSPKRAIFWQILIRILRKFLIRVISISLQVCEKVATAISFSPSEEVILIFPIVEGSSAKIGLPRYQVSRDPPKRFIPIPDSEIGGCARSDSAVPAI